jgi:DNA-binding CsgD family transcriptional regulator
MTRLATFGRVEELAAIESFLEPVPPEPSALQIAGAAGIGKTTLLRHAMATASRRGFTVLRGVASQADSSVSLAVLADVLGGVVDAVQGELAPPQARALEIALLRADAGEGAADRRAIATAALETIRAASRAGPVFIAIDDLQWVDESSAHALAFALRRLEREPVLVAATFRRGEGPDPLGLERLFPTLERLDLGPLDARSLKRMLEDRRRPVPSLAGVRRLAAVTGGNPLFALELSRSMGDQELPPGEMPDPPTDLVGALRGRLSRLPRHVRESLLTLAAIGRPTSELAQLVQDGSEAIARAEEEGILEIAGHQISFTHPLYASTVYAMATPGDRRAVHRRLADASSDIEERARHLALAAEDADSSVAAMLDRAADAALARGAPGAAAELMALAIRLTPTTAPEATRTRTATLSECLFQAGDTEQATALLEGVAEDLPTGPARADALYRLALFACNDVARARMLLERALADLGDRSAPELRARIFTELAWVGILGGSLGDGVAYSERARTVARESSSEVALGLALTASAYGCFLAGLPAGEALDEAQTVTEAFLGIDRLILPRTARGALAMWAGDLDDARVHLEHDHREITERGQLSLLWEVLVYLAELEVRAGNWEAAAAYASEGLDSLEDAGLEQAMEVHLWSSSLVAAHRGEVARARARATRALHLAEGHQDIFHVLTNRSVLGFLELSLGDPEAAERWFEPLDTLAGDMGLEEPGAFPYVPDEIEALVLLGEFARARGLLERFEERARARDRGWALATAARCRGLILAAEGDAATAFAALDEALALHAAVPQPFDLARTVLVQGRILRRSKRKAPARAALEQALEIFRSLGAPLWAAQAESELSRIGGRAPSRDELTPTERQVADLAAEGKTNREVAAALFMSTNTVNANLKRVYRKLGLRSRTELAARLPREPEAVNRTQTGDSAQPPPF